MPELPDRPFLTEDFSPDGAGIDFLGMRWVNLEILARYLLPDVNNATSDFGVYCLAAWIPWKFMCLCKDQKQFTLSGFTQFRQAIEVAASYVTREDSSASKEFGTMHTRIGARQKLTPPSKLTFDDASRTEATSIYAAPLYGPSMRYLGLIAGQAMAKDGTSTGIPLTATDENTMTLVTAMEEAIAGSHAARDLEGLVGREFAGEELDDLGKHGLHPAFSRHVTEQVKKAFLAKLLPQDDSNGRMLTARLILHTLRSSPGLDTSALRHVWHTGLLGEGKPHHVQAPDLVKQRGRWQMLMVRQYQRYILEYFLKCFELGMQAGHHSVEAITDHALRDVHASRPHTTTLRDIFLEEAQPLSPARDFAVIAERWRVAVHREHACYVETARPDIKYDAGCAPALAMLARWWFGSVSAILDDSNADLAVLGGEDRISMRWFVRWVERHLDVEIRDFVRSTFEQLVFAQHVRVALSRFDGRGQRLRFTLGDEGIIPTKSMATKLATGIPGWMIDRLGAFVNLLTDLSVLEQDVGGRLRPGSLASGVLGA